MNKLVGDAIRIILFLVFTFLIFYFMRLFKAYKIEKRVTRFSLKTLDQRQETLIDKIKNFYNGILDNISRFLKKVGLFKIFLKHYKNGYVSNDKIKYPEYYFISTKVFFSFLSLLVVFVLAILKVNKLNVIEIVLAIIIGFVLPDIFTFASKVRKKKEMEEDLLKAVIIMNNAFKSGRSIMQAIELVSLELNSDMGKEFRKMFIDITYGLELETVFDRFYKRVNLDHVKYISSSLVLVNKTGGNITSIFSSIEKEFYERKKLQDELFSQTALSNLVFRILIFIPFVVFLFIYILNPGYFSLMISTDIGRLLTLIILLLYISYILIVRKIVKVEVW